MTALTIEYESPRSMMVSSRERLCPSQVRSWLGTRPDGCRWQIAATWNNYWNHAPGVWTWTNHENPYYNEKMKLWCWLLVPVKHEKSLVGDVWPRESDEE